MTRDEPGHHRMRKKSLPVQLPRARITFSPRDHDIGGSELLQQQGQLGRIVVVDRGVGGEGGVAGDVKDWKIKASRPAAHFGNPSRCNACLEKRLQARACRNLLKLREGGLNPVPFRSTPFATGLHSPEPPLPRPFPLP